MQDSVGFVEERIGYVFKNKDLLKIALTHSSYSNEHRAKNNERLEFLGDSVLGFIVSEKLFRDSTEQSAGVMTSQKQRLVSTVPLSSAIKRIGIGDRLLVGESLHGKELPDSVLENLFEAIVAAIYLDGGIEPCERFINENLLCANSLDENNSAGVCDYKSELQTYAQGIKAGTPKYTCISKTGPDHMPTFVYEVEVAGIKAIGEGKNKSEASQTAACRALKIIRGGNS